MLSARVLVTSGLVVVAASAGLVPLTAGPALGSVGSGSVQISTACGSVATTLVLRTRDGGSEAQYSLDQNRQGRTWKLTMTRNGKVVAQGARTTHAPGGSFRWRVMIADAAPTDTIAVTARRGTRECTLHGRITSPGPGDPTTTPTVPPPATTPPATGGGSSQADTIKVDKCYTNATKTTGGELLIKASSSDSTVRLYAYRPDGSLIGEVQNGGGGRYGGTVMPYQPNDPGRVTIKSSAGGSVTVPTGPFQL
jgi:hypothetical protein